MGCGLLSEALQFFGYCLLQESENLFDEGSSAVDTVKDIEDIGAVGTTAAAAATKGLPIVSVKKRKRESADGHSAINRNPDLSLSWKDALGPPPPMGKTRVSWSCDKCCFSFAYLSVYWLFGDIDLFAPFYNFEVLVMNNEIVNSLLNIVM